jgi:PKD repeat protein
MADHEAEVVLPSARLHPQNLPLQGLRADASELERRQVAERTGDELLVRDSRSQVDADLETSCHVRGSPSVVKGTSPADKQVFYSRISRTCVRTATRRTPGSASPFRPVGLCLVIALLVVSGSVAVGNVRSATPPPNHSGVPTSPGGGRSPGPLSPNPSVLPAAGSEGWFNLSSGFSPGVPGNRTFAALAYDPTLNGTLMFGGFNHVTFGDYGDTWLFADGVWTNLSANLTTAPSGRWAPLMTWDPWNSEMVLFGGRDTISALGDTWVFNSSGWTQLSPSSAPSSRQSQFSVFTADPTLRAVYLYGGSCYACGTINNDSWTFVNGSWQNVSGSVTGGPSILDYGGWNPPTSNVLGYASTATNCSGTTSTLSFNGSAWSVLATNRSPGPVSQGGGLVYDAVDSQMLLFGGGMDTGGICGFKANTWSYANGTWANLTSGLRAAPYARCCESVAYDQTQKVVVLLGGAETSQAYIGDTWTFPVAPLRLSINISSLVGGGPFTVNLSGNLTGGAAPLRFNWSFGDGTPNATTRSTNHTFGSPGQYSVVLTVADGQGREINRSVRVHVVPPLVTGASASPTAGEAPLLVNFSANGSGGIGPFVYAWSFGDGATGPGPNASHTYLAGGNYTANVSVRDGVGQRSLASVHVTVAAPLTVSVRTLPLAPAGDAGLVVNFSAFPTGSETPFVATWSFHDNTTNGVGLNVRHQFVIPGLFPVTVSVVDAVGHVANATVIVNVSAPLVARATASHTVGLAPFSVAFNSTAFSGTPPYTFQWSFGDGSANVSGPAPNHVYGTAGRYVASLTATDAYGESVVSNVSIHVVVALAAVAHGSVAWGIVPLTVQFNSSTTGGVAPVTTTWAFGDGVSASIGNVTHIFAAVRSYSVVATMSDALNEVVQASVAVDVYSPLSTQASVSPSSISLGQSTDLTALVVGGSGAPTFAWMGLPPGCATSTGATVSCTPSATGTYTINVTATDSRNDTSTASVLLTVGAAAHNAGLLGLGPTADYLVAAAAIAAVVVAVLLLRRRPPPPAEETPIDPEAEEFGPVDPDRSYIPPPA